MCYLIPGHGQLVLSVPNVWKEEIRKPPLGLPPTIVFRSTGANDFEILLTVGWNPKGDPNFNKPERLRQIVGRAGEQMLP